MFCWFLYQKVLRQDFCKKESSTESLVKRTCVLPFLGKKSMQLRTRLVNSIESKLKFCKLSYFPITMQAGFVVPL